MYLLIKHGPQCTNSSNSYTIDSHPQGHFPNLNAPTHRQTLMSMISKTRPSKIINSISQEIQIHIKS